MRNTWVVVVLFASQTAVAGGYVMAPDGTFVSGPGYSMAPDGSYVSGSSFQMAPDGSYVGSTPSSASEPSEPPAMRDYRDNDGGDSEE